jgi:hypothetical protein
MLFFKSAQSIATLFFRPGAHIMSHTNPLRGLGALVIGTDRSKEQDYIIFYRSYCTVSSLTGTAGFAAP